MSKTARKRRDIWVNQLEPYQIMPALAEEEYQALKRDIRVRGVLVALEFDAEGNLLDGHHRMRAVRELREEGVKVDYTSVIRAGLTEYEKRTHVRAINLRRRHLTQAQRRELIAGQLKDTPGVSNRQIADRLGVSDKTVAASRHRLESIAEIPRCASRQCRDGRKYPSVVAHTEKEAQRALVALKGLDDGVLPGHPIPVKIAERIRREADSAARARNAAHEPSGIGDADIRLGDFRSSLADIEDGSVGLIVTDLPYHKEALALWSDLAVLARRILRPGGLLLAYSGQSYLPDVLRALTEHLDYVWMIAQTNHARKTHNYHLRVYANWKPIILCAKPPFVPHDWFNDVLIGGGPEKGQHAWQQREDESRRIIEIFSRPGDLIVDPFCGSGTVAAASLILNRRFQGCDIDPVAVGTARERVRMVQRQK